VEVVHRDLTARLLCQIVCAIYMFSANIVVGAYLEKVMRAQIYVADCYMQGRLVSMSEQLLVVFSQAYNQWLGDLDCGISLYTFETHLFICMSLPYVCFNLLQT
jgi:hypothetical protein